MPEYLAPGVYMEEFEIGARPIEGASTSTAGFLGRTERGPTIPVKQVTSLTQFMRIYGGYIKDSHLAYGVDAFFSNGGQRCYIGRIAHNNASPAKFTKDDITFTAVGPGSWGQRIGIRIENASGDPNNIKPENEKVFKLTIAYWNEQNKPQDFAVPDDEDDRDKLWRNITEKASLIEIYDDLSEDENSQDHYVKKLSEPLKNLSDLILIDESSKGRPSNTEGSFFDLLNEDGDDGDPDMARDDIRGNPSAQPGEKTGLSAFNEIDDISIVYVPDIHFLKSGYTTVINDILVHCETLKDRFAILDIEKDNRNYSSLMIERPSKYGALYYPWMKVYDPRTEKLELKPPGPFVAGIYARSDNERGVHKAPANELVKGAIESEFPLTRKEQATLNPRGINVILKFKGRGIMVWGARTAILDPNWKYINVRRLFIYIEKSIINGTQWVVFEPNNEKLWARVKATITQFLTGVWKDGALMGTKPEEAFFVKCDRSTMTQDDIDNGRLICIIGIAPTKPAEFVIFRIAQWQGGSAATE
jgi:phage tail sheath protein FI